MSQVLELKQLVNPSCAEGSDQGVGGGGGGWIEKELELVMYGFKFMSLV